MTGAEHEVAPVEGGDAPADGPRRASGAAGRVLLILGLLFFLGYSWMFSDITVPNERTRVYLAVALVDCGTIDIDCAVARFGPVNDWARFDGRYYTDKAPGSSLLGAIPCAAARVFSEPGDWTIAGLINLQRRFLMIPLALLGALLFWRLLRRLGVTEGSATVAVAVWLLGSTALYYASAFYGHQIVAVALLGAAYWGLIAPWRAERAWLEPNALLSGVACGVAGLVEYQAIPLSLVLALAIAHRAPVAADRARRRRAPVRHRVHRLSRGGVRRPVRAVLQAPRLRGDPGPPHPGRRRGRAAALGGRPRRALQLASRALRHGAGVPADAGRAVAAVA